MTSSAPQPTPESEQLLTYRAAAKRLGLREIQLLELIAHGRLKAVYVASRDPRIRLSDLRRLQSL